VAALLHKDPGSVGAAEVVEDVVLVVVDVVVVVLVVEDVLVVEVVLVVDVELFEVDVVLVLRGEVTLTV
jgi:hypothetical protein